MSHMIVQSRLHIQLNIVLIHMHSGVHLILKNTLDPSSYFRLSPYLCENYELNETQPDKIKQMIDEAKSYIDRNDILLQRLADKLKQDRLPNQKIMDFTSQRKQTHEYFLF